MAKNNSIVITGSDLTIEDIGRIVESPGTKVKIASGALASVRRSHEFLTENLGTQVIYGINTGFGPMASHILAHNQLEQLQFNLIRSHAVGIGDPIAPEFVLAAMVVRLNTLAKGMSGVSVELLTALEKLINHRIIPVVPEHGAVGTSGDLVQLSHIALAMIGEGEVFYKGRRTTTKSIFTKLNIKPYALKPKEGLSLINGTSVMSGILSILVQRSEQVLKLAISNGALALELLNAFDDGISLELNGTRPHPGQIYVAERLRTILKDSKLLRNRREFFSEFHFKDDVVEIPESVQEVYSIRCMPQILGPVYDTIQMARERVETEINSATDNPIVSIKQKKFLHGGNFHGDYISATADQVKMTIVKLTMLAERQINFFLNNNINKFFPPFLNLKKPGLTLGLQGMQFVATSTTAQSQTLAFPQYVHSISTNADNQDVVSMGTDSALMLAKVIDNAFVVLGLESLSLAQGVDFLGAHKQLCKNSLNIFKIVRKAVPIIKEDRVVYHQLSVLVDEIKKNGKT